MIAAPVVAASTSPLSELSCACIAVSSPPVSFTSLDAVASPCVISGRFEALVAIAQGSTALFSCLERRVEGRALRGVGPPSELVPVSLGNTTMASTLLSGMVAEAQWAPDVRNLSCV